jgi:DNA-binding LacI/PurR family transcriptional regulator
MPRLRGTKLSMRPLATLVAAGEGTIEVRHTATGELEGVAADALIVVGERRSEDLQELLPDGVSALAIGDAVVPRQFSHAISEARAAARMLARVGQDTRIAWTP